MNLFKISTEKQLEILGWILLAIGICLSNGFAIVSSVVCSVGSLIIQEIKRDREKNT